MSVISVLTEYNIKKDAVFRDKEFKFPDGRIDKKRIIILSNRIFVNYTSSVFR